MKSMRKILIIILIFSLNSLCFSGCGEKEYSETIFAMDTVMTISAYGHNAKKAILKCENEINRLDKLFSTTNENSEIYKLNHRETEKISKETYDLIEKAFEISKATDGAFDISLYPLSLLWGFTKDHQSVPTDEEISNTLKIVGYESIELKDGNVILPKGFMLDLGGIAKGYASDRVSKILKENGVKSAVVSLGGNVITIGKKPNGQKWKVGIADPFNQGSTEYVKVSNSAVVTSGGYQRYFEENGKRYHHILSRIDGRPSENGVASVSVIAKDGLTADGLSTAFFVMGKEKTIEYCKSHKGISAVIITEDGEVTRC